MWMLSLGAAAMTSRGFREEEFVRTVELVDEALHITKDAQQATGI